MKTFPRKHFFLQKTEDTWIVDRTALKDVESIAGSLWERAKEWIGETRPFWLRELKAFVREIHSPTTRKIADGLCSILLAHADFGANLPFDSSSFRRELFLQMAKDFQLHTLTYNEMVKRVLLEVSNRYGATEGDIPHWMYRDIPSVVQCQRLFLSGQDELIRAYYVSDIARLLSFAFISNIQFLPGVTVPSELQHFPKGHDEFCDEACFINAANMIHWHPNRLLSEDIHQVMHGLSLHLHWTCVFVVNRSRKKISFLFDSGLFQGMN